MPQTSNSVTSATQVFPIHRSARSANLTYLPSEHLSAAEEVVATFFDLEVPDFLGPELERLYQSIYSTASRLEIYGQDKDVNSYVVRKGGQIISALLFRLEGRQVVVLNQQTSIDPHEIARFSSAVFLRYKDVQLISFWGLLPTQPGSIPYPTRRNYCLPEVVVTLPESADTYLSSLGKSTRRSIRSGLKKVQATFPSFRAEANVNGAIGPSDIFEIIQLNNARMVVKAKVSYNSDEETRRLVRLANDYGLVLTLKIDGRICAGAVGYRVGSTCHFHTLAHDPQFDEFKLGTVCCYLMMSECIARGVNRVCFGGSSHRYKFDFRGNLLHLDQWTIYRHIGQYLLYIPSALRTSLFTYLAKAKLWMLLADRRDDFASRVVTRIIARLRQIRHQENVPSAEE